MITSGVTKDIEVPNEPGVLITIRMLSHGALKKARDVRMQELAGLVSQIDISKFTRADAEVDEEMATVERDPLTGYDIVTVLHKGVKAWTYDVKCNTDNIDELDEATATHVAREIVQMSRRDKDLGEALSETSPVGS